MSSASGIGDTSLGRMPGRCQPTASTGSRQNRGTHFRDHERHVFHDSGFRLASQSPASRRDERPRRQDCGVHLSVAQASFQGTVRSTAVGKGEKPRTDPCLRQGPACRVTNGRHIAHTWSRYSLRASTTKSLDDALAADCLATCTNGPQPHTVLWHSVDDIPRSRAVSVLSCRRGHQAQHLARTSPWELHRNRATYGRSSLRSFLAASFLANNRQAFAKPVAAARRGMTVD